MSETPNSPKVLTVEAQDFECSASDPGMTSSIDGRRTGVSGGERGAARLQVGIMYQVNWQPLLPGPLPSPRR